jgi:hypothetical protein
MQSKEEVREFSPEEFAERQWCIEWIVYWNEWNVRDGNIDSAEFRGLLNSQSTIALVNLFMSAQQGTFSANIRWGAEHTASASPEQREAVIDAIVKQDTTGMYGGAEPLPVPTAGGCLNEAPAFWARARREHLSRLSPDELAAECHKMLEAQTKRVALHDDIMGQARSAESRRMAALVRSRYSYRPQLIEAARYCRQNKIFAKRASALLTETPLKCSDGSLVTFQDNRFVVKQGDQVLGTVTDGQFQREYWPLGKIPPTP